MKKQILIPIATLLLGLSISFAFIQVKGWYDAKIVEYQRTGALTLIINLSKEFKDTGEIRFAPILMHPDGTLILENGAPLRGEQRILIQKIKEFEVIN